MKLKDLDLSEQAQGLPQPGGAASTTLRNRGPHSSWSLSLPPTLVTLRLRSAGLCGVPTALRSCMALQLLEVRQPPFDQRAAVCRAREGSGPRTRPFA